jgi:hypothetical protein
MLKFGGGFLTGFVAGVATLFVLMLAFGDYDEPATVETVAAAPAVATDTPQPPPTDAPTPTQTPLPTLTPVPMATSMPTVTPVAMAGYSAPDIIHAFRMAGLPLGEVVEYTAETDPNSLLGRPGQYFQKFSWKDTRVRKTDDPGTDTGGTVEVFANAEDMEARKAYVDTIAQSAALLTQYSFGKGVVLVRLTRELTPEQASEYENILMNLPPR